MTATGKGLNMFQTIVLIIFGLFAVIGLIAFATFSAKNKDRDFGRVLVWGTIDQNLMKKILSQLRNEDQRFKKVLYAQQDENNFYEIVTDALASGEGPDVIIVDDSLLHKYKNKIYTIPYEYYPERDFKDKYIDGAELFLSKDGVRAVPFAVDPLVLFWNRDIFADNSIVEPPVLWKDVLPMAKKISKKDTANNIDISAIALGAYDNINHAKQIIATLFMQINSNITNYDYKTSELRVGFGGQVTSKQATKALRFYTSFANPVSNLYSWNRSLDNSIDMFTQDRLAMYIGYASDLPLILKKNSHLNFDVSELPQVDSDEPNQKKRVYGKYYAFAITKASKNKGGALAFIKTISQDKYAKIISDNLTISPVSRNLLSKPEEDALKEIFRRSAVISRAFIDPDPQKTDQILLEMVHGVISGARLPSSAVGIAASKIDNLIK